MVCTVFNSTYLQLTFHAACLQTYWLTGIAACADSGWHVSSAFSSYMPFMDILNWHSGYFEVPYRDSLAQCSVVVVVNIVVVAGMSGLHVSSSATSSGTERCRASQSQVVSAHMLQVQN
jgi:hypothetical protein